MTGTMGLMVGFAVATVLLSVLMALVVRRVRASTATELARQQELVAELRQERAEDKETNRRLRHDLHYARTAQQFTADDGYASIVGVDPDTAHMERDDALRELAKTQRRLESVQARLADREAKLRDYRDALKEIRVSLEAQDPLNPLVTITDDVSAARSSSKMERVAEQLAE